MLCRHSALLVQITIVCWVADLCLPSYDILGPGPFPSSPSSSPLFPHARPRPPHQKVPTPSEALRPHWSCRFAASSFPAGSSPQPETPGFSRSTRPSPQGLAPGPRAAPRAALGAAPVALGAHGTQSRRCGPGSYSTRCCFASNGSTARLFCRLSCPVP